MKIRNGFVSNSSSSSFIISIDKGESCKVSVTHEVDLASMGERIDTMEQLDLYAKEECWYDEHGHMYDYEKKNYDKMKELIESGKSIIVGSFCSDSGNPTETLLCETGLRGHVDESKVNVLYSEGGY